MAFAVRPTARGMSTLTRLHVSSSSGARLHVVACPQGHCATVLAMLVARGHTVFRQPSRFALLRQIHGPSGLPRLIFGS